jgi:hypothetical protein
MIGLDWFCFIQPIQLFPSENGKSGVNLRESHARYWRTYN